ncbi:MAG TPA: hypothetical protein VKC56_08690, partial [Gallionellaceae bacterium]|nr:hypothetical protein [Gallionellaceae bacterium]
MTTENPRVIRATRGKMLKFTFGAAIHRVVKMDMFDGVFEPGKTVLRVQWRSRIGLLIDELKKGPSVLRLTYYADTENEGLVKSRLDAMKHKIEDLWKTDGGDYDLTVETELFWRTGGPPPGGGDMENTPDSAEGTDSGAAPAAQGDGKASAPGSGKPSGRGGD